MHLGHYFSTCSYHDRTFNAKTVKILLGQYHATADDTLITTVLGSCVAVCLYDSITGVGGMNHYMLPHETGRTEIGKVGSARFGIHAINLLIEHVVHLGASRANLQAKVFGAGRIIDGMGNVGKQNAEFAVHHLKELKIPVVAMDVGDSCPRKIYFSPETGRVFVKRIQNGRFKDTNDYQGSHSR